MLRPLQGNTGGGVGPGVRLVQSDTGLVEGRAPDRPRYPDRGYSPSVALPPSQAGCVMGRGRGRRDW